MFNVLGTFVLKLTISIVRFVPLIFFDWLCASDAPPYSLKDSNVSLKVKIIKEGVRVRFLIRSISKVEGRVRASGWG